MMDGKQKTPSVIARLMGLDELPPQQSHHRQHKVLSDDYLRKTASIGQLEKRSPKDGHFPKISAETQDKYVCSSRTSNKLFHLKGLDDMLEDLCRTRDNLPRYYRHQNLSIKKFGDPKEHQSQLHSSILSAPTSTSISDDSDTEVCKKLDKMINQRTTLRSIERLENRQTYMDTLDLKDGSRYLSSKIVVLKPNSRRAESCARNLLMPTSRMLFQSDSDYMYRGESIKRENGDLNVEVPETKDATSDMEPPRRSSRVTTGTSQQTNQVAKPSISRGFDGLSGSGIAPDESLPDVSERISCQSSFDGKRRERISYPFPSGSLFAMEAKKQILERWKTTKNSQEVEVGGKRCTLGEMFVRHDGGARTKAPYVNSENYVTSRQFSHEGGNLEAGSLLHVNSKYGLKDKHIRNLPRSELFKRSSIATSSNLMTIGEASENGSGLGYQESKIKQRDLKNKAFPAGDSLEARIATSLASEDQQLEVAPGIEDGHSSSDIWENLSPQRSSCDTPRGASNSWSTSDSNLAMNFKELDQLSPDSVLEPLFEDENPCSLADLSEPAGEFELLDSRSEETNSECSGMNVSSDEDFEKGCLDVPKYNKRPLGTFRLEESQDFSYLVDVLDEASLCDWNLDNFYETSRSMEFPLNPSLFEALEKKYGKQTSWLKSDRKLLFYRINFGLKEIMNSYMDIQISTKSLRRRFRRGLRRDEIEEELWILLVNQEKEVSKDLSEKALGKEMKWLELEEEISIICREIEEFLFNELAAELDC